MQNRLVSDEQWMQKINQRVAAPAKTTEGRSVIHAESFAYHNCVFYLVQPQQQAGGSTCWTILAAAVFWAWVFTALIAH